MAQVDTSIYSNLLRAPKTVQEYDAEAQQAKASQLQNALGQVQYQNALRDQSDDQAYRDAAKTFGSDQMANANALFSRGLVKQGLAYQKSALDAKKTQAEIDKDKATAGKTDWETAVAKQTHIAQLASSATDQASWTRARQIASYLGADVSQVPEQFDPETAKQFGNLAMTQAERLNQAHQAAVLAETGRHNKAEEGVAYGRLSEEKRHHGAIESQGTQALQAPQYMETDAGLVALPKKLQSGQAPVGVPVMGQGGQPLGKPLKDIPQAVNTAIISNTQNINKIDQALALLNGQKVGALSGDKDATGWKGYAPQPVLNRLDPKGVDTRAMIADIGSLVLHDRSGAAVTASESPRLMPFIPLATDDRETAAKKLTRFKQLYQQEQQALSDTYGKSQGYKPSPVQPSQAPQQRTIVRTGTHNGRKVVQYSDGTTDYAD